MNKPIVIGRVWIDATNGPGWRPLISVREITRGRKKGQFEVTYLRLTERTAIVEESAINLKP